jgi:hypothetical protein
VSVWRSSPLIALNKGRDTITITESYTKTVVDEKIDEKKFVLPKCPATSSILFKSIIRIVLSSVRMMFRLIAAD